MCSPFSLATKQNHNLLNSLNQFRIGLSDAPTDQNFVKRLNTIVARRRRDMEKNIPATLADAIMSDGTLKKQAEMVALGNWLLLDSHPGMKKPPGPQPNPHRTLKFVAAILAEADFRPRKKKLNIATGGRESRKQEITKHDLPRWWGVLFGENVKPSQLDARLKSVRRILPLYLKPLKSGGANHAGTRIKKSPEIKRVLDAISGMLPNSQTERPDILEEPDVKHPAALVPFEIELCYQSPEHKAEYRRLSVSDHSISGLQYVPKNMATTSPSGIIRADRAGKILLEPDAHIRRDFRTEALIDRLVILVDTGKSATGQALHRLISKETDANIYVRDLTIRDKENEWGMPLPTPDPGKKTGYHFAIMIQEQTANILTNILKVIEHGPGIEGQVAFHLIEVSVDFYPKKPGSPEEAILRREQMVGLLQRHHWVRHSLLLDHEPAKPCDVDARQFHDDEEKLPERKPKIRYLFAHENSHTVSDKMQPDGNISAQSIRDRILTTRPGNGLFLNSTLVKGGKSAPYLTSIQHKIADRRNPNKKTIMELADPDRRARVEVTTSGTETLKECGLDKIDDLAAISFRKLTKDFLTFKLPMIEPWQHLLDDAKTQMHTRGVYGIDLRTRALNLEKREALRRSGSKRSRKTEKEGMALQNWQEMNDVIGKALDGLKKRWNSFTRK